ncbi:response regulator transcription factor [uncultured Mailhella sp.]|uniref:response regulator transcription factor n=1 Tax=uncultured Mailhella sp. TaxID=1981031 RepID=UPI0025E9B712|nr:response regulator transcription factor [uncultured Mailhella sp.]
MDNKQPVILVVEDDDDIRELVAFSLEEEGYHVEQAADGLRGQEMAETLRPDLIILDLMLPGRDGLSVCRELNKHAAESMPCPILMLTARGEEMDRIIGFEYGADDYVVKPFNIRELMLRVRAILRRRSMDTGKRVITRHGVSLDQQGRRVSIDGRTLELTALEYRIFEDFFLNAGRIRTREELLSSVWGYQFEGYERTVDVHIARLRRKLGDAAQYLETVRGMGYRYKE